MCKEAGFGLTRSRFSDHTQGPLSGSPLSRDAASGDTDGLLSQCHFAPVIKFGVSANAWAGAQLDCVGPLQSETM